jgi:hypothetical protein
MASSHSYCTESSVAREAKTAADSVMPEVSTETGQPETSVLRGLDQTVIVVPSNFVSEKPLNVSL